MEGFLSKVRFREKVLPVEGLAVEAKVLLNFNCEGATGLAF
jgi:hypothetical protein